MKIAASVFSWLSGIFNIIFAVINMNVLFNFLSPALSIIVVIIFTLLTFAILIWRESSAAYGDKIACGIFTLLFVSLIGGILTLCIPIDDSGSTSVYSTNNNSPYVSSYDLMRMLAEEAEGREKRINANRNLYKKHIITYEELERRVHAIDPTAPVFPPEQTATQSATTETATSENEQESAPTAVNINAENERVELIKQYKEMFDNGIISDEEFTKKKNELLNG